MNPPKVSLAYLTARSICNHIVDHKPHGFYDEVVQEIQDAIDKETAELEQKITALNHLLDTIPVNPGYYGGVREFKEYEQNQTDWNAERARVAALGNRPNE